MKTRFIVALAVSVLTAMPTLAQSDEGKSIVIYGMGAGIDGTVGAGPVLADVDIGFSDVLENLELGAMGGFRYDTGRWSYGGELIFLAVGNHDRLADIDVDQWVIAGTVGYELTDRLELLGGARYMDLEAEASVIGPAGDVRSVRTGESWVDPFAGVRLGLPLGARSSLVLQATVGGFGVGSDLAVDALAFVELGLSERSSLLLGYRAIDVDYESGSGANRFVYDTLTQGPAVGLRIRL